MKGSHRTTTTTPLSPKAWHAGADSSRAATHTSRAAAHTSQGSARAAVKEHPLARGYIPGLDGMRAIAIIAVFIFHLRPQSLRGGYLGVDVFFVLSGFLISTLLVRELSRSGKIDLPAFWVRRARRLIPALVIVVVTSVSISLFAGNDLLVNIGRQVVGALTFSNNWVEIAADSSYFNATSPQLFINFWSLAVEEQFYLIWPLIFVLIMAFTRPGWQRVGTVLFIALASVIAMAVLFSPGEDTTRIYYGTDTHSFGLMIGAALALSVTSPATDLIGRPWFRRLRLPLGIMGLAILFICFGFLVPDSSFTFRGGILIASLSTALVLATCPGPPTLLTKVLDCKPMAWIGDRSYGIYLWHWPIILLVTALLPDTTGETGLTWFYRALAVVVTCVVAALSFKYVEEPIRKDGFKITARRVWDAIRPPMKWDTPRIAVLASSVMAVIFAIAIATAPSMSAVEAAMKDAEQYINNPGATPSPVATDDASPQPSDDPDDPESAPPTEEPTGEPTTDPDDQPGEQPSDQPGDEPSDDPGNDPSDDPSDDPENPDNGSENSNPPVASGEVPPGDAISSFGDSMLYVAAPGLSAELPGINIDAESNRQWPAVADAIEAAVAAGNVRDYVVIAAGTNAGARDIDVINKAIDALGPDRKIVLVNIYGSSYWVEESNQNLQRVADARPNVAVANWRQAVLDNPGNLQPDQIHPNMTGMYLWAEAVKKALATLS